MSFSPPEVPRRQVPQLIVFASARQAAQSGHSHCPCCVCAGLGRDELHKLQDGAKSGLSFSPPGAAAASATADRLPFSPANCTERTVALSVLRLRGGWGETSCTSSRKAQNLVCPFHRQVPRRQVPQLIAFASAAANCTERTLALSVLRLRGGWGETSCTSSRTAQNLVCPFHRQVPRRQVPQLIAFASAQQIAQSGHSLCLCCVCAGAGARRAAQAPGRRKIWLSFFTARGGGCATAGAEIIRFIQLRSCKADQLPTCVSDAFARGLGRDELLKLLGRRKIWFVLLGAPGAADATAPA